MKSLSTYINEELEKAQLNKINALRLRNKKEALLAIKNGLAENDEGTLKALADTVYAGIANYTNYEDLNNALDAGNIDGWKEMYEKIVKANKNKDMDVNIIIDVIAQIANGQSLDQAITNVAKKI